MSAGDRTAGPIGSPIFCPVCGLAAERLAPGPSGRPLASCPWCGCLERHRLLTVLTRGMGGGLAGRRILEVAPSPFTTGLLRDLGPSQLVSADFDPGADGRSVDVQASLTHLPFANAAFDFVLCLHVLEHVPDDRAAMADLARVLTPAGVCLVQVPWTASKSTDENPEPADLAERIRRFGRGDHVRQYGGTTLEDRLGEAGLEVYRFVVADVFGPDVIRSLGLMAGEVVWLARPSAAADVNRPSLPEMLSGWVEAVVGPDRDELPDLLLPLVAASERVDAAAKALAGVEREAGQAAERAAGELADLSEALAGADAEVGRLRSACRAQRRRADLWERRYTTLRGRLPVRVAAGIGSPLRAAVRAARTAAGRTRLRWRG